MGTSEFIWGGEFVEQLSGVSFSRRTLLRSIGTWLRGSCFVQIQGCARKHTCCYSATNCENSDSYSKKTHFIFVINISVIHFNEQLFILATKVNEQTHYVSEIPSYWLLNRVVHTVTSFLEDLSSCRRFIHFQIVRNPISLSECDGSYWHKCTLDKVNACGSPTRNTSWEILCRPTLCCG